MFHVEQSSLLPSLLRVGSENIHISLDAAQITQFMTYLEHLQTWNQSFNLTAITSGEEIVIKHFIDSLAVLDATTLEIDSTLLDVGTGAGFPGIPLKIARPDLAIALIEPSYKKCSFLRSIVGLLRLEKIDIFNGTFERYIRDQQIPRLFDYITTRALNPDIILKEGFKVLREEGKAILYSSQSISASIVTCNWNLAGEHTFNLPNGYGQRVVSFFSVSAHVQQS